MSFRAQALTLVPSIMLLAAAMYLSILSLQVLEDMPSELVFFVFAACFFFTGIVLGICWLGYWGLYRALRRGRRTRTLPNPQPYENIEQ